MNRAKFDEQFEKFRSDSVAAGCMIPEVNTRVFPVLDEDTPKHTDKDYTWDYLMHVSWAARRLAVNRPHLHADFGSYSYFAGICSAFVPEFFFFDIRPLTVTIEGLRSGPCNLTKLNFPRDTVESISSLHVIEHVGLGRYGDELDVDGQRKAAAELVRILKPGGHLLMVLPMAETEKLVFNAHRIATMESIGRMFPLKIVQCEFLYNERSHPAPPLGRGEFTGCFDFVKP